MLAINYNYTKYKVRNFIAHTNCKKRYIRSLQSKSIHLPSRLTIHRIHSTLRRTFTLLYSTHIIFISAAVARGRWLRRNNTALQARFRRCIKALNFTAHPREEANRAEAPCFLRWEFREWGRVYIQRALLCFFVLLFCDSVFRSVFYPHSVTGTMYFHFWPKLKQQKREN